MATGKGNEARQQRAARERQDARAARLAAAGAPVPPKQRSGTTGAQWLADQLQPREWDDIRNLAERVGYLECLAVSGSAAGGGFTVQLQVLPAYAHKALDLVQRSEQGVLCLVAFQVPWQAFLPDHESAEPDGWDTDDMQPVEV